MANFSSLESPPPADFTHGLLPLRVATPLYPLNARNMQIEGWAMVNFSVDATGNVIQSTIEVVDAQPPGFFERSATIAARDFEFENTTGNLIPDIRYVFRFELEQAGPPGPDLTSTLPTIKPLVPRRYITPRYPPDAAPGIVGYVEVEFTVMPSGEPAGLNIVASQPPGVFEESALDAAGRLLFDPRIVDGEPVAVEKVRYRFDWHADGRATSAYQ